MSRATSEDQQRMWQDRSRRLRRHRELVDHRRPGDVVDAIAEMRAEHNRANGLVADQVARSQVRALG